MKLHFKNKAIQLRRKGLTYSEILKHVPVAKSTLSEWLRSVKLAKKQFQKLTEKKRMSSLRGSFARKKQRIENEINIKNNARIEVGNISNREEWLCGVMLYWSEGAKQKENDISVGIKFSNSDSKMLVFFVYWLKKYLNVIDDDIVFELYLHENFKEKKDVYIKYWSTILNYPINKLNRVYFKKNK
ncbi:MAG: hypothetical protein Q7R95_10995, partial [bacterium]|nr:hypothetical protein [bacterium]